MADCVQSYRVHGAGRKVLIEFTFFFFFIFPFKIVRRIAGKVLYASLKVMISNSFFCYSLFLFLIIFLLLLLLFINSPWAYISAL